MNTSPHKGRLRSLGSELLRSRFESPGLRRNHTSRPHRMSTPEHRKISTMPFFFSVSQRPSVENPGCVAPSRMSAHSAANDLIKIAIGSGCPSVFSHEGNMAKESRYRESSRLTKLGGSLKAGGRAGRDLQKSAGSSQPQYCGQVTGYGADLVL